MVVDPSEQDLLRGQPQELLQGFILVQQSVELGVKLDVNLPQESATDNLPDETEDEMFSDLNDISSANVDDGATNSLCGLNDNVVVLAHLEGVEIFGLFARYVENSFVDCVGDAVVDELGQHQTILALVKHLKSIGRERQAARNISVTS